MRFEKFQNLWIIFSSEKIHDVDGTNSGESIEPISDDEFIVSAASKYGGPGTAAARINLVWLILKNRNQCQIKSTNSE